MTITSTTAEPGIVAVTVDYPPVNAIPSRGWFELGRRHHHRRARDPEHPRGDPARRGPRLQRRRRHQGDAAHTEGPSPR